ncbi:MAG: type III pantothenate kinase [Paraperlucidibaca sp.]
MRLLLDLGNTRLKACIVSNGLSPLEGVYDLAALASWLTDHGAAVTAVAIASVASESCYEAIEREIIGQVGSARIYRVRYDARLLKTEYELPERLGIDRWLALLPFAQEQHAIVVDAGTAFTIDVLRGSRHIGGYILPGLGLQRDVLAQQTAAVKFSASELGDTSLGLTTAACVGHGGLRALVALTYDVQKESQEYLGLPLKIYMAGGDAPYLARHLNAELRPLLVFEGMLIALEYLIERNE